MAKKTKYFLLKDEDNNTIQRVSQRSLRNQLKREIPAEYWGEKVELKNMINLLYIFGGYKIAEIPDNNQDEVEFYLLTDLIKVKINL